MSDAHRNGSEEELDESALAASESPAMRALLKRSLASEETTQPDKQRALLLGVQRKLRERSRGKFYGDGWSTANMRVSHALVACMMLLIIAVVYFFLGPSF